MACRGRVKKKTGLKLWCFCSAESGFKSRSWHLSPFSKTLHHYCCILQMRCKPLYVLCNACKGPQCTYWKEKGLDLFKTCSRTCTLYMYFKNVASKIPCIKKLNVDAPWATDMSAIHCIRSHYCYYEWILFCTATTSHSNGCQWQPYVKHHPSPSRINICEWRTWAIKQGRESSLISLKL